MNIKLAAVNALKFVKKFGMTCGASGTKGLVRLADGTVEEQYHYWDRRGKHVRDRRVVGKDELAQFSVIGYLEDHLKMQPVQMVMIKNRERVLGRTELYVHIDDANFRLEEPGDFRSYLHGNAQSDGNQDGPVHEPGRAPTEHQRPAQGQLDAPR